MIHQSNSLTDIVGCVFMYLIGGFYDFTLPTYERQDKIIELISSCYQKEAPWGAIKDGRNDPCPCGSGKKYKKCCINKYE